MTINIQSSFPYFLHSLQSHENEPESSNPFRDDDDGDGEHGLLAPVFRISQNSI